MAKTTIYVPDIECDSCVRLISKSLEKKEGVKSFTADTESVHVELNDSTHPREIIKLIEERGFRASLEPFERKTFKERWHDFMENKSKYEIERIGIGNSLVILLLLVVLELVAYVGFMNAIPDFVSKYGIWIIYLDISVAAIGLAIWHVFAYKARVTCMVGMMIGMTAGMQAGMMIGAVIGATNGFFTGAMTGMLLGVFVGAVTGKCCGIMGLMQGMMAGMMGGTMGAMISVMMIADRIAVFMPFYMLVNILIVLALPYMVFEETVEGRKHEKKPMDLLTMSAISIIAAFVLVLIMLYGPKSLLFQFA